MTQKRMRQKNLRKNKREASRVSIDSWANSGTRGACSCLLKAFFSPFKAIRTARSGPKKISTLLVPNVRPRPAQKKIGRKNSRFRAEARQWEQTILLQYITMLIMRMYEPMAPIRHQTFNWDQFNPWKLNKQKCVDSLFIVFPNNLKKWTC